MVRLRKADLLISRLFKLISEKEYIEASALLNAIKALYPEPRVPFTEGYLAALSGMVSSLNPKDRHKHILFLQTLIRGNPSKEELDSTREKMLYEANVITRDKRDRGFFMAWIDYIDFLMSLKRFE